MARAEECADAIAHREGKEELCLRVLLCVSVLCFYVYVVCAGWRVALIVSPKVYADYALNKKS